MKTRLLLGLLSLFILLHSAQAEVQPYRIAVIIPLSGPVASLGENIRKGVAMAYDELAPEQKKSIELLFEDDQFDTKQTIAAYQRLSATKQIDAIFVLGSPPANALAPLTEKKKQILMAIGASDPDIVKNRSYAFIQWVTPTVLGEKLAQELSRRDFKRLGFVTAEATGALADTQAAIDSLTTLGKADHIVYRESFDKGVTDYKSPIESMRAKKTDAVVVVLFPGALSSFAKQARQQKLGAELIGMETFEDEAEVKAAEGALLGTWYVNAADAPNDFSERYKKVWNQGPGWSSANGYDSVNLIATALKQSNDQEKIREFLASIKDYHGALGTYSASGDNRFLLPAAIKRVTENGFETLK